MNLREQFKKETKQELHYTFQEYSGASIEEHGFSEEYVEWLEKKLVNKTNDIHDVSLSCYLFKVDGEDCFVLGENISDAIDRLEKEEPNAEYELVHSKSLDCIY